MVTGEGHHPTALDQKALDEGYLSDTDARTYEISVPSSACISLSFLYFNISPPFSNNLQTQNIRQKTKHTQL